MTRRSRSRNYTRGAALGNWIGSPCYCAGTINRWQADGDKIYLLINDVTIRGPSCEFVSKVDHLWVKDKLHQFKNSRRRRQFTRLDKVWFLGEVQEYTRTNGTSDIGVTLDFYYIGSSHFIKHAYRLRDLGRWQEIIDLLDSGKIVMNQPVDETYKAKDIKEVFQEIRRYCEINLAKLAESKRGNKPQGLDLALPAPTTQKKQGFGK
jgi:hypothetical protein